MFYSIAEAVHAEVLVKKSRFIACVEPVQDRAAALKIVGSLRAQHPGAAHVCWALMAGGQSAAVDDGEPSGTAGRPMLEVLRHQNLEGVLATVVRYFGGVKLGAGGLVGAYTDAVAQAIKNAQKIPIIKGSVLNCRFAYSLEGLVRREVEQAGARFLNVQHDSDVLCAIEVSEAELDHLVLRINDGAQGRVVWLGD
jgi:uncharacterized YigZ family protein